MPVRTKLDTLASISPSVKPKTESVLATPLDQIPSLPFSDSCFSFPNSTSIA